MITIIKIAMTVGLVWVGLIAAGVMFAASGVLETKKQMKVEKFLELSIKGIAAAIGGCLFAIAAVIAAGLLASI